MNLFNSVSKPEYVFRPLQIFRRLSRECKDTPEVADIHLPWGLDLRVRPTESIGSCVWRVGVYDVCVSECLWRLIEPGETALDVGANIGHMTGLIARRLGQQGKVIAFEPHPELFSELQDNISVWRKHSCVSAIELAQMGVSSKSGGGVLHIPKEFSENRGVASLSQPLEDGVLECDVALVTLDEYLGETVIGMMKLDVEGHELEVLKGAQRVIGGKAIRDVIFEEHDIPPTPVTDYFESRGYTIFHLDHTLFGPRVVPFRIARFRRRGEAPSLLATAAPSRVRQLLAKRGWHVLRERPLVVAA